MPETETIEALHNASLEILERVGVRLHDTEVLSMVAGHGIAVEGGKVFFKGGTVMDWVAQAPGQIHLKARDPEKSLILGCGPTVYGPGYGCPAVVDGDGKRAALMEDYLNFLKLVQLTDALGINGGLLVQPTDLAPRTAAPLLMAAALAGSDKPLLGIAGHTRDVEALMRLGTIVFGGDAFHEDAYILTLINTTSPLQIDTIALDTMRVCAAHGQPVIISPGPIAGATGPITPAGNIALSNAEALATIAIAQMLHPGTPVIYGVQATAAEMRTGGVTIGSPIFSIQAAYGAALAKRYGLPCRGAGAGSDAAFPDSRSGYESMLSLETGKHAGIDLMLHSAGILESYGAMSVEKFCHDVEMIRLLEAVAAELDTSAEALALDTIAAVGPGGQFLSQPHTMRLCRKVPFARGFTPTDSGGGVGEYLVKRLAEYQQPALERTLVRQLRNCLEEMDAADDHIALALNTGARPGSKNANRLTLREETI